VFLWSSDYWADHCDRRDLYRDRLRHVGYAVYTIQDNKIRKVWEHTKYERVVLMPSEDERVDSFEITAVGPPPDDFGDKLRIEGVRTIYPAGKDSSSDFPVEKLPTKYYCCRSMEFVFSSTC